MLVSGFSPVQNWNDLITSVKTGQIVSFRMKIELSKWFCPHGNLKCFLII